MNKSNEFLQIFIDLFLEYIYFFSSKCDTGIVKNTNHQK